MVFRIHYFYLIPGWQATRRRKKVERIITDPGKTLWGLELLMGCLCPTVSCSVSTQVELPDHTTYLAYSFAMLCTCTFTHWSKKFGDHPFNWCYNPGQGNPWQLDMPVERSQLQHDNPGTHRSCNMTTHQFLSFSMSPNLTSYEHVPVALPRHQPFLGVHSLAGRWSNKG